MIFLAVVWCERFMKLWGIIIIIIIIIISTYVLWF
jgi:hypothetical protein